MASADPVTREKVRALVREVLKSAPADPEPAVTEHVIVNSLKPQATRQWDRDESAKSLITEDDLRGLEPGSRLRVSSNVRFTPLAGDLVAEKGIVLLTKESRDIGLKIRSVAIGADHGGFPM